MGIEKTIIPLKAAPRKVFMTPFRTDYYDINDGMTLTGE